MAYGLLGRKLGHSLSPEIHGFFGDYEYKLFGVEPGDLASFFDKRDFDGLNVTIPYKQDVIAFCDRLSETAGRIGSVNTIIKKPDGSLFGDNTDYFGFKWLLESGGVGAGGKKILILGSGGASLTVGAVLRDLGASETLTVSRRGALNYENVCEHADADIIVNTTPVGMYPGSAGAPVSLGGFRECSCVIDLIYNPLKTDLLLEARELGIPFVNGMPMLVAQAFRAAELFSGKALDPALIPEVTRGIIRARRNIVLIGMPGSGKSTVAKALSELTGLDVTDTDEKIEETTGESVPDIFARRGESAFRAVESRIVAEIGARSGNIVSVGGGAVLSRENRRALMQNGFIVYLTRDLNKLNMAGRPLSQDLESLREMERIRAPIYEKMADITTPVIEDQIRATVRNIADVLL